MANIPSERHPDKSKRHNRSVIPAHKEKKSIATSAIFKPNTKNGHSSISRPLQKTPILPRGVMKNSTVKERSATKKQVRMSSHISFPTPRVHPLEQRCRDDLETWRAEAYSQAQHGIDETCSELLSTLSSTIESEQVLIVDAAVRKAEVFKSLDREQVRLVRTTAKGYEEASVTTLGESMRAFQSLAETERASQEALWEEWDLVQAEVVALGLEILGPEDFGSFD